MTDHADETPLLPQPDALSIATRESFLVGPPYSVTVMAIHGDMVSMCVTRMTDGRAREFSMAIGRRRTPVAFTEVARNVWRVLLAEHEAEKRA